MSCALAPELTTAARTAILCLVEHPQPLWTVFIGPAIIAISAFVALLGIRNVRRVARERATLDLIEKVESDSHYRMIVDGFYRAVGEEAFERASSPQTDDDHHLRRCVADYLNHYELVCIGIRRRVLDEGFYRTWMEAPLVKAWNDAAGWIQQERWKREEDGSWSYYPKHFENLEWGACRWSPNAQRLTRDSAAPVVTGGPGDAPLPESTIPPLQPDPSP